MSLILLVSPVFNVEIREAVCYFMIFKKKNFFGKVNSLFPRGDPWKRCGKEIISQLQFVDHDCEK